MRNLTKVGMVVVLAAAVAILLKISIFNGLVQAEPESIDGVSPYKLLLQSDTKGLPVLEIADLI